MFPINLGVTMDCFVGIDIGAVGAKAALLCDQQLAADQGDFTLAGKTSDARFIYIAKYRRTRGRPLEAATEMLDKIISVIGMDNIHGVSLTGSASKHVAQKLGAKVVNEFKSISAGLSALGVDANTVFEMGGETSKYLRIEKGPDGTYGIVDYSTNGDCAAGTGSFIDQQAGRLKYTVEQVGDICLNAERAAQIAGRCSVFAKSDMIHAQQKGYSPAEVLRGLCDAVARNFRSAVVRSHAVRHPVALLGGVMSNTAVVKAMREAFELADDEVVIPECHAHVAAIGAAAEGLRKHMAVDLSQISELRSASDSAHGVFPTQEPLSMDHVLLLRDKAKDYAPPADGSSIDVYMGIDVGSVSTNLVAVDEQGRLVLEIYTRTQGRPVEVVTEALAQIDKEWAGRLIVRGVGTTGSGRELIGELVGADTVNDEITAHKTGSTFVGRQMLNGRVPDTIFEIGGQDSKYISLQDGVVVDFTMNEACAAGTGSFLEERAEELDISIINEFAELALSSKAPIRLGERCTVFMERDVNSYVQRGAATADLVAGLAYSVAYNYINRVVRGRHVGDTIFFQGGTAYNNAVAAAFARILDKQIIVPPHNGVVGAIGAALLAREKMGRSPDRDLNAVGQYVSDQEQAAEQDAPSASRFRGYDLTQVEHTLREFTCKGCSNACQIQEFTVEGEKTYWGDKCSDRFRKRVKSSVKAQIDDLVGMRMKLLLDESTLPKPPADAPVVGIPLSMFAYDMLPFWRTFLHACGFNTVLSSSTNKNIVQAGLDSVVAEPCFPIIAAHGHVAELRDRGIKKILLPNIVSLETAWMNNESHLCPWHQTLPFVVRQAPSMENLDFITPTLHFREGAKTIRRELAEVFIPMGVSMKTLSGALERAYLAQESFAAKICSAGEKAIAQLHASNTPGIVLLGRPYNVHDIGMNLSVARKLRDFYGVNCIPMDFLSLQDVDTRDINNNMYWDLGRRILAAAKLVRQYENLRIIYITNFKCGPDSYLKHYVRSASGKPFLTLQFDGHSNDAGMMTRCEAYLDSTGILRRGSSKPRTSEELARTR